MSELKLDVDQGGELKAAFRRGGWTNEEIKKLCEGGLLEWVRDVILGRAIISPVEHLIDLDSDPLIPKGWKVQEHKKGGKWKFDPKQVKLHLSKIQMSDKTIVGIELRKELASLPVMNANLLDWYLAHPEFIPEEWESKAVFFWGTIYRDSDGGLCVRFLCWNGDRWSWNYLWLPYDWNSLNPALVLAS